MRIVINGWFWGHETAGSGQYLTQLLAEMAEMPQLERDQLRVIVPEGVGRKQKPRQPPPIDALLLPEPLPRLPTQLAKVWWEQVSVPAVAHRERADLLWVPYWAAPFWQPVPTVVTVHDLIPRLLPAYRGGRLKRIYTALVSLTARKSTALITVSDASKRDVVRHLGVAPDKVHAISNGANVSCSGCAHDSAPSLSNAAYLAMVRTRYQLPERYFLYLGGFDLRKNVSSVIDAYHRYLIKGGSPDVKLVIAGNAPEQETEFFPDPLRRSAHLGLDKQVYFCGQIADEDKPALYHLSVAYVFPSLYEGFGMTVVEAMAAGAPVVTSKA